MIIGSGDIASVLPDRKDLLFFASGVSNSQERNESEYSREIKLLLEQPRDTHIVYFSSLGIFDSNSRYYSHKLEVESIIKSIFSTYTIIRIGNITWGSNPRTFINYLKAHPEAPIRDEYRYIVDKEELLYWINRIPNWSCEMNIPGQRMKVIDVMRKYGQRDE